MHYNCCDGIEYFITANVMDPETTFNYLIGFLRLRMPDKESYNGKLPDTAIIRELHVYSKLSKTYNKSSNIDTDIDTDTDTECASSQHMGIGSKLLKLAEDTAKVYGYSRISVTSGVGVRGYYIKKGYKLENGYMIKNTNENMNENVFKRIIKNSFNYVMSFLPIQK